MGNAVQKKESFADLLRRADAGDSSACAKVGHLYATGDPGLGVARDYALARKYYETGAQTGDTFCMYGLAAAHLRDNESDKAIPLLEACAQRRHRRAMAVLGDFYLRGHYVPKDPEKAFAYLKEYFALCTSGELPRSVLAVRWDLVLYPLCLLLGVGCDKDEAAGLQALRKVSDLGNLSATAILNTGRLEDPAIGERFGFNTRVQGPVSLFDAARQGTAGRRTPLLENVPAAPGHLSAFLKKCLISGEKVLLQGRFPRIYTVDAVLRLVGYSAFGYWICLLLAKNREQLIGFLPERVSIFLYGHPLLFFYVFAFFGVRAFISMMITKWTTHIVLTDRRFIYKHGLVSVEMIQMNFWQIEHTDVNQSLLGSMLDYGHVLVQSYALHQQETPQVRNDTGLLRLPLISHPYLFTRVIEDHRRAPPIMGYQQNLAVPGGVPIMQ